MAQQFLPMFMRYRQLEGVKSNEKNSFPFTKGKITFAMAQEAVFLDSQYYAVGRWDGSLSIFKFNEDKGPTISCVVSTPSCEGVQMIVPLTHFGIHSFITSNNEQSMTIWSTKNKGEEVGWKSLDAPILLNYDKQYGVANRGIITRAACGDYLVVGHATGYVTIWKNSGCYAEWVLEKAINVSGPPLKYEIHNIRGIAEYRPGIVITGSEDGMLTMLDIVRGEKIVQRIYDPNAKLGINNIALQGDILLVVNCTDETTAANLWSYKLKDGNVIEDGAKMYLKTPGSVGNIYNFDVLFIPNSPYHFLSSTSENVIWHGKIGGNGEILDTEYLKIDNDFAGLAMCMQEKKLAVTGYNLHEFIYQDGLQQ